MAHREIVEFKQEGLTEDWSVVESILPEHWEQKARELNAFRRGREIASPSILLRVMLIHLAQGCGLRETAVMAEQSGLARVSDVAVLKRLKGCEAWFEWMSNGLRDKWLADCVLNKKWAGHRIRLVDGTMVSEPGYTGSKWRLHYSIGLPELHCQEVILTTPKEGETLRRFSVTKGDIFIADRCYANSSGIAHVVNGNGEVIIRTNLVTLPLFNEQKQPIEVLSYLRELSTGQCGDWPVLIKNHKQWIAGRLCAIKKSAAAAEKAKVRVKRESQRNGTQLRPETLEAAEYIFLFTTLPVDYAAATIMELYRARWQIELAFKRLKSLMQLGHLKKHDAAAARAWLQGKLLVAFLIDALLALAEHFSPWGYIIKDRQTHPLPMAGDRRHA